MDLQNRIEAALPTLAANAEELVDAHGDKVVSELTVRQLYGGMRGVRALICDTSSVDPERGLIIRGIPVGELTDRTPEEIFFLLCTGALPDRGSLEELQRHLAERYAVPDYVWNVLKAMPPGSHPMTMFDTAILVMQRDSRYAAERGSTPRKDHWKLCLDDAITLLGRLPGVAAGVYRLRFNKGQPIPADPKMDWSESFAHMMGMNDPQGEFRDLMRLYLVLHSDHESGNVSAHTGHLVGSAGSDLFYSICAALNGLAGPLHGLANQECLAYVLEILDRFRRVPTDDQLAGAVRERLAGGQVIPGYGHAVLRCDDPRYTAFVAHGEKICAGEDVFETVKALYRVVPPALVEQGKAKNPHPNVDAASGALLHHFGITEFSYYTVLFGLSRAMGISAQYVLDKAFLTPIERPKSVTTDWIVSQVKK